ncbi:MAG: type II toxin-antitoxin system prevent-host-death family antitoxin [Deltaproteobacteria bacterium]|nr:type II toxin-antitoxin system prevent-host-death family antitoxin [Deltaproteobacteria bacterium]
MPRYATVRELKNQTTALIRDAEKGNAVVVTRRGKPVATLKPFEPKDLQKKDRYPTTAFDALRKKILGRHPELAKETPEQARREFERITRKIRRSLPFQTWQEMDRFAKGDRYGFSR